MLVVPSMWLQVITLAAAASAVQGMCFGVPLLEQAMSCPEPMIYYSQLCICIEPKNKDRLHEIGSIREVPLMAPNYPVPAHRDNLFALRHRLTASLPDMSSRHFSSSARDIRPQVVVLPDRFFLPTATFDTMANHVPRSWQIGGLMEIWPGSEMIGANALPTMNTGDVFNPAAAGWSSPVSDMSTLSLLERLHSLRSAWREASLLKGELALENAALKQAFLKHLPATGISPDTARSYMLSLKSGSPDSPRTLSSEKTSKAEPRSSIATLKKEALMRQGLSGILPQMTTRQRGNSFHRSAMRLKSAMEGTSTV